MMKKSWFILTMLAVSSALVAADIKLIPPQKTGGKSLMECIAERKTARTFDAKPLSPQDLSNLLYAADGMNRPDGRKTVPTARNVQDLQVYAALPDGMYLYEPRTHALKLAVKGDLRGECGKQKSMHQSAPVVLVYVSDYKKMANFPSDMRTFYAANHAGYASQNVYLYAASAGMNTVVCGLVDKSKLARLMKLKADQHVLLTQPVGYAKK